MRDALAKTWFDAFMKLVQIHETSVPLREAAVGATLLAFAPPLPHIAATIGGLLFGIGVAWMGYAIWSSK